MTAMTAAAHGRAAAELAGNYRDSDFHRRAVGGAVQALRDAHKGAQADALVDAFDDGYSARRRRVHH